LGIINIAIWNSFKYYWPIGLILAGIAFLFRARAIGWILIIATIIFGIMTGWSYAVADCGDARTIEQKINSVEGIDNLDLDLDFGAGEIKIQKGSEEFFAVNKVQTSDKNNPFIKFTSSGSKGKIMVKRAKGCFLGENTTHVWNLSLIPDIPKNLYMDYGAANVFMDFRDLNVQTFSLHSGASATRIIFDDYNTSGSINTGASDIKMDFPENTGVKISVDSGATSTNMEGFLKKNNVFYSENYDYAKNKIEIGINAGASSIKAHFY